MKEVAGWCSACLLDTPVRLTLQPRSPAPAPPPPREEAEEDNRALAWDWNVSDNARTEQRMKKHKDHFQKNNK